MTLVLWCSTPVGAFKIDTHVWSAQEVLNDALRGVQSGFR
jgi:hypothetical protein